MSLHNRPALPFVLAGAAALLAGPATADPLSALRDGVQPGCAVMVLGPSGPTFDAAGFADLEARTPITPDTRFVIASASKSFTALAVLTLADQGRIGLDDPAERWLPELAGAMQGATVRQLLNQTAGVRDHTILMALAGVERLGEVDPAATLAMMQGLRSGNFTPGERAQYSNGNYLALARLVDRVSGRAFADYADEAIFAPLSMADTRFRADAPIAHGYRRLRDGSYRIADDQPALPGSGGLATTVRDLARFDAAFRAGLGPWSAPVKAMFLEPGRLSNGAIAVLPEFGTPYGAGVGLEDRNGVLWLGHDGGSEGFRAEYVRQATGPRGAAVLCNRSDVDPGEIVRALLGEASRDAEEAPAPSRPPRPPASEAEVAAMAGRWRSDETGIEYDIRLADGGLRTTIRSPLWPEPIVEDWGGLRHDEGGGIASGPLRLRVQGDILAVSFGRRVENLAFRRVAPDVAKP